LRKAVSGFALFSSFAWLIAALVQSGAQSPAQSGPPGTDIYVANLAYRSGRYVVGKFANITKRPGYDNQPSFLADGQSLLYTSIRDDKQADIYRYAFKDGSTTQLTATPESEYSPTPTLDGKSFSVIRVEADSSQRLWKFPFGGGEPALVLKSVKPVGYHLWIDERTLALFILGKPNTLQIVDAPSEHAETIAENIGRSLLRIPGRQAISFVHKVSAGEWVIKALEIKSHKIAPVVKTLAGSEDCAWTSEGQLIMAREGKLYQYDPAKDKDWREFADLSSEGVTGITRLAVSPQGNRLALVAADAR